MANAMIESLVFYNISLDKEILVHTYYNLLVSIFTIIEDTLNLLFYIVNDLGICD